MLKRNMFWIFLLALVPLFLASFGSTPSISQDKNKDSNSSQPTGAELDAVYAAEELMNIWAKDRPEFFGGAYRKETECIVFLVEDNKVYRNKILAGSSFDEILTFERCEFSLNYLQSLYEKISDKISDTSIRYHISIEDNSVVVKVSKEDRGIESELTPIDIKGGGRAILIQEEDAILADE